MLAGAGYAVLLINYRGSLGYGNAFMAAINGRMGELEFADLMAGVDHCIELGLTDPERLGVCGSSYGGYLTCWAVSHTDRFKAAVVGESDYKLGVLVWRGRYFFLHRPPLGRDGRPAPPSARRLPPCLADSTQPTVARRRLCLIQAEQRPALPCGTV